MENRDFSGAAGAPATGAACAGAERWPDQPAWANRAEELARIHLEAIGGRARADAISSLQASGWVVADNERLRFTMYAARPNRVRIETEKGGRMLVQATDGEAAPWEFDSGTWPPVYRTMRDAEAQTFLSDAEFDDPLIAGESRGFTLDDASDAEVGGRKFYRVLVTRTLIESYLLYLDAETYLVMMRVEQRRTANGRAIQIITHYNDFRPVDGVLVPHEVVVVTDDRVTQHAVIEKMIPNPKLPASIFHRPQGASDSAAGGNDRPGSERRGRAP